MNLARITRQVSGLFDRRIATADDRQALAFEERAVAHRTVRDALARVLLLARDAEFDGRPTGREDHRLGAIGFAARGGHVEPAIGSFVNALDRVRDDLRAELPRVIGHLLRQLPPLVALTPD